METRKVYGNAEVTELWALAYGAFYAVCDTLNETVDGG